MWNICMRSLLTLWRWVVYIKALKRYLYRLKIGWSGMKIPYASWEQLTTCDFIQIWGYFLFSIEHISLNYCINQAQGQYAAVHVQVKWLHCSKIEQTWTCGLEVMKRYYWISQKFKPLDFRENMSCMRYAATIMNRMEMEFATYIVFLFGIVVFNSLYR